VTDDNNESSAPFGDVREAVAGVAQSVFSAEDVRLAVVLQPRLDLVTSNRVTDIDLHAR